MPTIEQLERMLTAEPGDTFLLYALGQEHAKAGAFELAIAAYDRVLALEPDHAYAHFHKARALEAAGRIDEARRQLQDGQKVARASGDGKAAAELDAYLEELAD